MRKRVVVLALAASLAAAGHAQLDGSCVVSAFNRTVAVNAEGVWVLPNVPANAGPVRVRATCVAPDGTTRSGQSDWVNVSADTAIRVADIHFNVAAPIPARLTLEAPSLRLSGAGATVQVIARAEYSDGTWADVSNGATGSTYRVSSAAVATVSADGLVTAVASGVVLVSAAHEGTVAAVRLEVTSGGDSDGDGLPDDWELANGLNPSDPVDGFEDPDEDGLSSSDEFGRGTNPRVSDTDGDGLLDGDEVERHGTDPALPDTDGDQFSDGLEILTGTDPLDGASFDLAAALQSLAVDPQNFALTVNQVGREVSRQLRATGILLDGSIIDLTSRTWGTGWSSSDLLKCSFGGDDGEVFAGDDGPCIVTARNAAFTAEALGVVRSFAPGALAVLPLPGPAHNVDVAGGLAYVAAGQAGLVVVDVSVPTQPAISRVVNTPGEAKDVRVADGIAYVADGQTGLLLFALDDPSLPVLLGSIDTPGDAQDVAVAPGFVLVAGGAAGVLVIDTNDPSNPTVIATLPSAGNARGVDFDGESGLAIAASGSQLHVLDLSTPALPQLVGTVAAGDAVDVDLVGSLAVVADRSLNLTTVDLSNPAQPRILASVPRETGGVPTDVEVTGGLAVCADYFYVNAVPIVDVSEPATPRVRAAVDLSELGVAEGTGIAADGSYFFLTAGSALFIGQYWAREDAGSISPEVRIVAPADGAVVPVGVPLLVEVRAVDDVAVGEVHLVVDGQIVSRDVTSPYRFSLPLPPEATELVLGATAVDLAGNVGEADEVHVSIGTSSSETTVLGRVVNKDGTAVAGALVIVNRGGSGWSGPDGAFAIAGVDSGSGQIRAFASASMQGEELRGSSALTPAVGGGVTSVGDIVLRSNGVLLPVPMFGVSAAGQVDEMVADDFDDDGVADLAVTSDFPSSFSLLFGRGDGTLDPELRILVSGRPTGLTTGDIDNDGLPDLVTSMYSLNRVSVRRNAGDRIFDPEVGAGVCIQPESVQVADFDGDGYADIAVGCSWNDEISLLFGRGDGSFEPEIRSDVTQGVRGLQAADMNGDGLPDLVVSGGAGTRAGLAVLLNDGDRGFLPELQFSTGQYERIAAGDVNGDGRTDVVATAGFSLQSVIALFGAGDGSFSSWLTLEVPAAHRMIPRIADMNNDGAPDIVVTSGTGLGSGPGVVVHLGRGDGTFVRQVPQPAVSQGMAIGDFDVDGAQDVALGVPYGVTLVSGLGDGSLHSYVRRVLPQEGQGHCVNGSAAALAIEDIDSDGDSDVLYSCSQSPWLWLVHGRPDGSFEVPSKVPGSGSIAASELAAADLNGDGHADLIARHGGISILYSSNGGFDPPVPVDVSGSPTGMQTADLNDDGNLDLITIHSGVGDIAVLLGDGGGGLMPERRIPTGWRHSRLAVCDFTGDGVLDIATASGNVSTEILVQEGSGNGEFSALQTIPSQKAVSSLATGDLDEDGRCDLAVSNASVPGAASPLTIYLSTVAGLELRDQHANELLLHELRMVDLDDDGWLDVIATSELSPALSVYLGKGDGTVAGEQRYAIDDAWEQLFPLHRLEDGLFRLAVPRSNEPVWLTILERR